MKHSTLERDAHTILKSLEDRRSERTHLLVVHLLAAVRLHPAPRLGEVDRVGDLEDALRLADPADDPRVVEVVVQHVPDEDVERREGDLGRVLPRPPSLPPGHPSRGDDGRSAATATPDLINDT